MRKSVMTAAAGLGALAAIATAGPGRGSGAEGFPVTTVTTPNATSNTAGSMGLISQGVITKTANVPGLAKTGIPGFLYDIPENVPPPDIPATGWAMRKANRVFTRGDAKKMMALSVKEAWPVLKKYFALEDWQQSRFVALMLGQSTRESTLVIDVETGVVIGDARAQPPKLAKYGELPSHAYGLLQTAVTAFYDPGNPRGFDLEDDVPELFWYPWKPENFYDPQISNYMGLRKMCHFALQARNMYGITDKWEVVRLALRAHNVGHANRADADYYATYPDMCARMGEWYFRKGLTGDAFTYTGNSRSQWVKNGKPTWNTAYYEDVSFGDPWRDNWRWFWTQ